MWGVEPRQGQGGTSAVTGLEWARVGDGDVTGSVRARAVVLATGGYANDHTDSSLLARYRPDLVKFATTNTKGTTGDGHKLALAAGAAAVDMEHVQVHPTGTVQPLPCIAAECRYQGYGDI
jgi:succinate dehydrogenase/fumarate reductase flavoprotein subunit